MRQIINRLTMALTLTALITIGGYQASYAHAVEIDSGWRDLGDTCTIKLPNLGSRLEQPFKPGDPVLVELGYDGSLNVEFSGYIAEISPRIPYELRCEDGAYLLKRKALQAQAYKSITLRRLLNSITEGFPVNMSSRIPEVDLSPFRIEAGATVAQVLTQLKDDYGLTAYFRGDSLFVGLPYTEFTASDSDRQAGRYAEYTLSGNDAGNVITDDLTYRTKDQYKIKARAVSILPDNSRIEVEVGDPEGEKRTLHFRNIKNQDALREIAQDRLDRIKYDGYTGEMETFGLPYVIHGATAEVNDPRFPDRAGKYLVDRVRTTWGMGGMRRTVELGPKVTG